MNSVMTFSSSSDWDLLMTPEGKAATPSRLLPFTCYSIVPFLFSSSCYTSFFLSCLTTTYLYTVVVPIAGKVVL